MIQSFDTQLQVSMRALQEIVAPALAGADKHVVEQLHLVVAALQFMRQRLPAARAYYRDELQFYITLSRDSAALIQSRQEELCAQIGDWAAKGAVELERPEAEIEDYQRVTRRLRESLAGLAAGSAGDPGEDALEALIVARTDHAVRQARIWCLPLGFELDPEALQRPLWSCD